ncbi:MAG: glycosyltransferase family 2 protein [Pirellulales bacterium]|nr:glycosyltransferase family 2 protein [Pirellulales bacterium]
MSATKPMTATDSGCPISSAFEPGLVSVVMPTYNRAGLLPESLDSIARQTYRPIEILIIDDGSTDETKAIVDAWARKHTNDQQLTMLYLRQSPSGAPAARNRGLNASHGEFIQFLDSDDVLHPEKFQKQIGILMFHPEVDYVYSEVGMFETEPDFDITPCFGRATSTPLSDHVRKSTLNVICGLYRRGLCREIGGWNTDLRKWQDWEYNVRMLATGAKCRHFPGVYALARQHRDGRIADLSVTQEGLDAMERAAASAEQTLVEKGLLPQRRSRRADSARENAGRNGQTVGRHADPVELSRAMAARYFLITLEAIRHGYPATARSAVRRGLRYGPDMRRRLRYEVLRGLACLPSAWGSRCCNLLLRTYRKARLP